MDFVCLYYACLRNPLRPRLTIWLMGEGRDELRNPLSPLCGFFRLWGFPMLICGYGLGFSIIHFKCGAEWADLLSLGSMVVRFSGVPGDGYL